MLVIISILLIIFGFMMFSKAGDNAALVVPGFLAIVLGLGILNAM